MNLRDAWNTTFKALFDPLFQRHHGDGAIFTSTKEAKLNHAALLVEAYELDIPAIRFERRTYRLQNLFDLRLDGIWHEACLGDAALRVREKSWGIFVHESTERQYIEYVLERYQKLAVRGRQASTLETLVFDFLCPDARIRGPVEKESRGRSVGTLRP